MRISLLCLVALFCPALLMAQVTEEVTDTGSTAQKVPDTGSNRSIESPVLALELRDQYGNTSSLRRQSGSSVVVVVVSVRRLSMIERWERDLSERVPGIRFLNVADLPDDVAVDLERTAATLRKRVPAGVAVLMDPDRQWATSYTLDTALPNLLVFDAHGRLIDQFRGRWTAALAAQVANAVTAAELPAVPAT